ncbi:MAG: hypothetical protein FWG78_04000 [Coriobacteriia bacterium]|nr:hypothetical protein [Coriobacteriia bacterium]
MVFVTAREIATSPRETWEKLAAAGELTITKNGQPTALMLDVDADNYDDITRLIKQTKARLLINRARAEAADRGHLSPEEIETEIRTARHEVVREAV